MCGEGEGEGEGKGKGEGEGREGESKLSCQLGSDINSTEEVCSCG